jgi:hypothetical protein
MKLKLIILAAIALIFNIVTISPARADVAVAALPKPTIKLTCDSTFQGLKNSCQSIKFVEEFSPLFTKTTRNLFFREGSDRLFSLNDRDGIACLIDGEGSIDGSVMCGVIDKH